MNLDPYLPLAILLSSALPGALIFFLREESHRLRIALNMAGALVKLALVVWMIWGVFHDHTYASRLQLVPGLDLVLNADALAVLFVALSTVLWLVTTVYAIGYLEDSPAPQPLLRLLQPLRLGHGGHRARGQSADLRGLLRDPDARHLSAGRPSRHPGRATTGPGSISSTPWSAAPCCSSGRSGFRASSVRSTSPRAACSGPHRTRCTASSS